MDRPQISSLAATANRVTYLDFMRFIAAMAVLCQHVFEKTGIGWLNPILSLSPGVFGVVLFFFISGYVIPFSIRRNFTPQTFVIRRLFRIFPAYLVILAVAIFLAFCGASPWRDALEANGFVGIITNALLIQEYVGHKSYIGVAWTLAIEFIWYGAFLIAYLMFGHKRIFELSLMASLGLIALSLFSIAIETRLPLGRAGMLTAALLGYAAYALHEKLITPRRFYAAAGLFLAAICTSQIVSFGYFTHPKITLFNGLSGWLLASGVFLSFILSRRLRESAAVNNPFAARMGEISYSVYLTHAIFIGLLDGAVPGPLLLLVVPALTIAFSILTFTYVEKPGIALGKSLTPGRREDADWKNPQKI